MFSPFLGLNLLEGVAFSCFRHFFALLLHLSLVVGEISSEEFGGWRGGKLGPSYFPRCVSLGLGLQQLLKSRHWLTLYPHGFWDGIIFLGMTCRHGRKVAEITS